MSVVQEEDGSTGLHHAAKLGNLEVVTLLLSTGQVDINAQVWITLSESSRVEVCCVVIHHVSVCCRTAEAGRPSSGRLNTNTWT